LSNNLTHDSAPRRGAFSRMDISRFIRGLESDDSMRLDVSEYRFRAPLEPHFAEVELPQKLTGALTARGLGKFYTHQREAIELLREGNNVVVMTPTGSGKSLIYNVPVLESVLEDPEARALYIFPLKGLEQDQFNNLAGLAEALGIDNVGAVYDGDTTAYRRRKIRDNLPNVIFTNPDMLHLAINAFHPKWEAFFRKLRYVVIDEIHTYRGVFGSHVAQVLRRLRRIARRWGAEPLFIACSATIANPGALARDLTGLEFKVVGESGAPLGGLHFAFLSPHESPYTAATRLFRRCLRAGFRTIVFTRARKITELIYSWTLEQAPEYAGLISPYRAGFLPRERREIEQRLFSGELLGVVSTSALELGVDIGGLDACILVGYPGSVSSTWQRAGRVGRRGEESAVFLVAARDALDQYIVRHPDEFFGKSHEAAVIDPYNRNILKAHLPCAAREVYLKSDESVYDMGIIGPVVEELVAEGKMRPGKDGDVWYSSAPMPHREVGIRAVGETYHIYGEGGRIGELSGMKVFREAFPGALYLHMGRQYRVQELDLEHRRVRAREVDVRYYTQALTNEETDVINETRKKRAKGFSVHEGSIRIRQRVVGYDKKGLFDGQRISRHGLDMPECVFDTEGIWLRLSEGLIAEAEELGFDVGGTLHAFEHAAISALPLFALCDKSDIGGISYEHYPPFGSSAIFIYDGMEGGVGLSRRAFDVLREWLKATLALMEECPCESGCPSCVQDPQCGSGNQPLDKGGATWLTRRLLSEGH
jgi:DEAD/DEAH box helicase domain-containing protein